MKQFDKKMFRLTTSKVVSRTPWSVFSLPMGSTRLKFFQGNPKLCRSQLFSTFTPKEQDKRNSKLLRDVKMKVLQSFRFSQTKKKAKEDKPQGFIEYLDADRISIPAGLTVFTILALYGAPFGTCVYIGLATIGLVLMAPFLLVLFIAFLFWFAIAALLDWLD